jgi:hypothetical protein
MQAARSAVRPWAVPRLRAVPLDRFRFRLTTPAQAGS